MGAGEGFAKKTVRRAAGLVAYVAVGGVAVYYIIHFWGAPFSRYGALFSTVPTPLQVSPVFGPIGFLLRVRSGSSADEEKTQQEFLTRRADKLAVVLRRSVEGEIKKRGLTEPKPLQIQWQRVERSEDPTEPRLIRRAKQRPIDPTEAAEIYLARRGRVVLIGAPGAGKTAVTLFMQAGLLGHRRDHPSEPVPLVLPLSSWNPETLTLAAWAASRLEELSPDLAAPQKVGKKEEISSARYMIDNDRILLILDAMDEMPKGVLGKAFAVINKEDVSKRPLIVTCRTEDYEKSLDSGEGEELTGAVVIELLPTDAAAVRNYLPLTSQPGQRAAWKPVLEHLKDKPLEPLAQALKSPLMVWLAGRVYRVHPEDLAARIAGAGFRDVDEVEDHLLERLVPSAFTQAETSRDLSFRWRADRAEKWLRFLAAWVKDRQDKQNQIYNKGSKRGDTERDNGQDLAWWRLTEAKQARWFARIGAGLFGGLVMGSAVTLGIWCVFWNRFSHQSVGLAALGFGGATALYMGIDCARQSPPPTSSEIRWPRGNWGVPGVAGLIVLTIGAGAGVFADGTAAGTLWGLVIAVPTASAYAFGTPYVDTSRVATPVALYHSDIGQSVVYTLGYAVSLGAFAWIYHGWIIGVVMGALAGLAGGFTYGVIYTIVFKKNIPGVVAWLRFRMAHFRLAVTGHVPWRFFTFLQDAHKLGVLRQSGASYQFSHLKLRDQLAKSKAAPCVPALHQPTTAPLSLP